MKLKKTALARVPFGVLANRKFFLLWVQEHKRKNWLFSCSPKGAAASAAIYSLVETAKANGLRPHHYLDHILGDLPGLPFRQYPKILDSYLPWHPDIQKTCASSKTGK